MSQTYGVLTTPVHFVARDAPSGTPFCELMVPVKEGTLVIGVSFPYAKLPDLVYPADDPSISRLRVDIESYVHWLSPLEMLAMQAEDPFTEHCADGYK